MNKIYLFLSFLCTLLLANISAQAQVITTFAGNNMPGYSGDGGPATAASLNTPSAITTDAAGNIYIADGGGSVVRKVDIYGIITTIAGNDTPGYSGDNGPATTAMLNTPQGIAVDTAGNIYIADDGDLVVRKVDRYGIITTIAGTGIAGSTGDGGPAINATFNGVVGLAVDKSGNLYVADGNTCVRRINSSGIITTFAGNGSTAGYAGDNGSAAAALLNAPLGLSIDDTGNLYIADNQNNVIRKVDTSGIITTIAGNGDYSGLGFGSYSGDGSIATAAELNLPTGVFADRCGNIFISDQSNEVIRCVNNAGIITTIAGTPGILGYSGDSSAATAAYLARPTDITLDQNGNLYIDDSHNNRVRKVAAMTITADPGDTICHAITITFTANTMVHDTGAVYQWRRNNTIVGTDSFGYAGANLQNGDIVSCTLMYGTNLVATDSMIITRPPLPAGVSITASTGDTICAGADVTYTAMGDPSYIYQWLKNGISFDTGMTLTYTPANGDQIVCIVSGTDVCGVSVPVIMTVRPFNAPVVYISSSAGTAVCPGASVSITANNLFGGPSPLYKWLVNGDSIATTDTTVFTYTPAAGDIVKCFMTSNDICLTVDTASSNSLGMTILPLVTPAITISLTGSDTVCAGTPVRLSATAVNGGASPSFHWFKNGIGTVTDTSYTFTPADGDMVRCVVISSACASPDTAGSNTITISVTPSVLPGITIATGSDTVCSGASVTFTTTDTNAGTAPVFLWKVNGVNTATTSSYSYTPANGDVIKCLLTSNANCLGTATVVSESITMSVEPYVTPSVSVAATAYTVCAGSPVTYTATAVNGGTAPVYLWIVNGIQVSTGNGYTYAPVNGDIVSCALVSNARCLIADTVHSGSIIMTVNPTSVPAVSIVASAYTICPGTAVSYTATPVNGGAAPTYQWLVNSVNEATGSTYSYVPTIGDIVSCVLTSDAICPSVPTAAYSVAITVSPLLTPSVTVSSSPSAAVACAGAVYTFTATPANGGSSPIYQWYVNGLSAGVGATYSLAPASGDNISVVLTSSYACPAVDTAVSAVITMTVIPTAIPSVTTSESPTGSLCAGTSVTYSATPVNGGASPGLQWKVNGINTAAGNTYTYTPVNGDIVTCELTSTAACATPDTAISTAIAMTVNPVMPPTVSITAAPGFTVCAGSPVTYTATATEGGTAPTYQWTVNGMPTGTGSTYTYTPANGDIVSCVLTSDAPCASPTTGADTIHMTVEPDVTPAVTITATPGTTVTIPGETITFHTTVTNGGPSPTYQWEINGIAVPGATSPTLAIDTFTANDSVSCIVTSNAACAATPTATSNKIDIQVSLGINQFAATAMDIKLIPNPNNGSFMVKGDLGTEVDGEVQFEVTDMLGQAIYHKTGMAQQGKIELLLTPGTDLANGLYLLTIRSESTMSTLHFAIEK